MEETLGDPGLLLQPLVPILEGLASVIDLIGIAIVLWGFGRALIAFVSAETYRFKQADDGIDRMRAVRLDLGTYILLGIEFMIASDIIHTVITRELGALAFVTALVAIRTAISFFLGRELAEVRRDETS